MSNLPARRSVDELSRIAKAFAVSGFFDESKGNQEKAIAQAFVKVLAGEELGIGAMQAQTGFHVVQGKPVMSAPLMGGLIKRSGKYDYRVRVHTEEECVIDFIDTRSGEIIGSSAFTIKDAQTANLLSNPTWKKFSRNMLFARALSNGARWHTPDVFMGPIYTAEELGASIDDDGIVVESVEVPEQVVARPPGAAVVLTPRVPAEKHEDVGVLPIVEAPTPPAVEDTTGASASPPAASTPGEVEAALRAWVKDLPGDEASTIRARCLKLGVSWNFSRLTNHFAAAASTKELLLAALDVEEHEAALIASASDPDEDAAAVARFEEHIA